jgi:hypothetical protein
MPGRAFQVMIVDKKWAVVRVGESQPVSLHDRKQDAVTEASALAAFHDVSVIVYDLGGRPLPPDEVRSRWA